MWMIASPDGQGSSSFDAGGIVCPVVVPRRCGWAGRRALHGSADRIVPVAQAHHTVDLVLMHKLKVVDGSGHTGIAAHILIDHAGADGLAALVVLPQARGAMTR